MTAGTHTRFRRRIKGAVLVADDGTVALAPDRLGLPAVRLSAEETVALKLMTDGLRNNEIAAALNMTVRSFYNVRQGLFSKLGARTQEHAAAIAFRRGVIQTDRRTRS